MRKPDQDRHDRAEEDGEAGADRIGIGPGEPGDDAAGERRAGADRQIDLAGDDDGRHAEGDDAEHGDRAQHVEQIACRTETRARWRRGSPPGTGR